MNEYGLMERDSRTPLALQGVEVTAQISGLLAETRLTQHYRNDSASNFELSYTFPLPLDATLLDFQVRVGKRCFEGQVIPRTEAEGRYEEAITTGNSAFRLQLIRAGLYNASLGNVMAGEAVEITLSYAETLAWTGHQLRYRLPTSIAPRYGSPSGMEPWQRPETSLQANYAFTLSVTITGDLVRSAIHCPSHPVTLLPGTDTLEVRLSKGAVMDRDFILELENEATRSLGVHAFSRDTHVVMLSLLAPPIAQQGRPRDVVLILDCSGSMQGDSLDLAKEGILLALDGMQPTERFGLVAFGTHAIAFDVQLQAANWKNFSMAERWVRGLQTMGGTELAGAMDLALRLGDGQPLDLLVLTDGEVWLQDKMLEAIQRKEIRIFTIGIGSAVAQDVVQKLADDTGGACELVSPHEDMSSRIQRHAGRMRQARLNRLDIAWHTKPLWVAQPARTCFAGDAHTIFAAFPESPAGTASVSFTFDDQASETIQVALLSAEPVADAVVRLGARQHLPELETEQRQDWAIRYQLMTEQTDYLIEMTRDATEKADNLPELQIQPQMLPAGWGGTSTVLHRRGMPVNSAMDVMPIDYTSMNNSPAVLRCRTCAPALPDERPEAWVQLMALISQHMPGSYAELCKLALPEPLRALLQALAAEHYAEADIVRAFYQACMDRDGSIALDKKLNGKIRKLMGNTPLIPELVTRIMERFDSLWQESQRQHYDIPAFLRRVAE